MDATVVVTGSTGPFGEQAVRAFAGAGATVVAGGRDRDALDALEADLREAGGSVTAVRADARDEFDLERLMETAARAASRLAEDSATSGAIDVVVPCAGVCHDDAGETPLVEASYSAYDDTQRTTARGMFAAVREAVPHLAADGRVLVPTGSSGSGADSGTGACTVAQATVDAIARAYAAELDQAVGRVDVGALPVLLDEEDAAAAAALLVWAAEVDADRFDGGTLSSADRPA